MAGNAWLSATDTMLDGLAQREALARQARLDQEAAARAAQTGSAEPIGDDHIRLRE